MMKSACICVLAHNEEAQIAATLASLRASAGVRSIPIKVYANGCTDRTVEIVRQTAKVVSEVEVVEIAIPSKGNAWNTALAQNDVEYLIFSDGDIEAEGGTIGKLLCELERNGDAIIAACRYAPKKQGISLEQKIVGFLQQPLVFDYLCGGLYAVNKSRLQNVFAKHSIRGIPQGVTGEDDFLDMLLPRKQLVVINARFLYAPPGFNDFCKVLARFRWQSEQLDTFYQSYFPKDKRERNSFVHRLCMKIAGGGISWWPGPVSTVLRYLFMAVRAGRILACYQKFGAVAHNGSQVLSRESRSDSGRQ